MGNKEEFIVGKIYRLTKVTKKVVLEQAQVISVPCEIVFLAKQRLSLQCCLIKLNIPIPF